MALRKGAPERGLQGGGEAGQVFWQQYDHAESGYVHRARLLDEMVELVPAGTASFNKKLARVEEAPDGGLVLFFADGTTAAADAVVGCDGIRSSTRAFVCGHAVQPAYSGQYAYRHLFPRDVAIAALGRDRALGMTLECGYGGYIIHYPVEGGSLVNMTAVRSDGGSGWSGDTWLEPTSCEAMLEDWRGWDPRLLELMARIDRPERRALFDLRHGAGYARGRVCLLGDSAHATTPHNGAGAAMAMEDAYVLSGLLAEVSCLKDLDAAFKAYDAVRRPRTQRLIENSRLTGCTKSFMCTGVWDVPEKIREQLDLRYRWIWEVNLEEQLEDAKTLMRNQARAHPSL
ncbi:Monooxygenase FAD-binding protein [Macrophomina phaseolina MS6]|uniref:Monooxygenase FAD-binding protein n=1 Tax=Macrophomina phaseolina (strain MS6) TaxID=1126212 RepID=K2S4E5_MACPH|nr:Monooxygenase FAD-binding protein [Macrophomina phaseolina MS6]